MRDAREDARDDLRALRRDARAQSALADDAKCFPECRESRARSRALREIVAACEARPRLGVTDARGRARGETARADAREGGAGDDARDALDGTTLDDGVDVEREGRTTRDGATGTKLWMTCDGIVFVVSAEASTREMGTEGGGEGERGRAGDERGRERRRRERKDDAVAGTEASERTRERR